MSANPVPTPAADPCELAPAGIRAIAPYQPGKPISELARELGLEPSGIIKLASNENPLGPSPRALDAARAALEETALYPDGNGYALKQALSRRFDIAPGRIVLGNGSNDVLELAARAFLAPGLEAVYSQYAFAVYALVTQAAGARGVEVAAREFGHDLEALLRAVKSSPRTRMVFVANPNNPTGTLLEADALQAFLDALPDTVIAVLDEAYNEYLEPAQRGGSRGWLQRHPNLIVTRTFSKAYGLAGLRAGYALADARVADLMNRVRQPFNVNGVALAAAEAALDDTDFVQRTHDLNRTERARLMQGLAALGLQTIPSHGNFISFRTPDAGGVFQRLLKLGVIVRPLAGYAMPEYLRVTTGLPEQNTRFLQALAQALPK